MDACSGMNGKMVITSGNKAISVVVKNSVQVASKVFEGGNEGDVPQS